MATITLTQEADRALGEIGLELSGKAWKVKALARILRAALEEHLGEADGKLEELRLDASETLDSIADLGIELGNFCTDLHYNVTHYPEVAS